MPGSDGVNVAMRVRPFGRAARDGYIQIFEPGTLVLSKPETAEMYEFEYTHAMMDVDNAHVYECAGRALVDSVLDGINGTVLAYGQTGSGKTFTMLGPEGKLSDMPEHLRGVMPRALQQLFAALNDPARYSEWQVQMTYVEVYCEEIRDLLAKETRGVDVVDSKGVMTLKNVTPQAVRSMPDAMALIEKAQSSREVATTNMNARSSRSHTILTVWLSFRDAQGGPAFRSKLNLVDLAGSERRNAVGTTNAKTNHEGDMINKSLLALQRVVMDLSSKSKKPSFRDSKLTRFLQDSIGGNCRTNLITCAYGDPSKLSETLSTCRFAENMMKVVVTASKNKASGFGNKLRVDPKMQAIMDKKIAREVEQAKRQAQQELQQEMAALRQQLASEAQQRLETEQAFQLHRVAQEPAVPQPGKSSRLYTNVSSQSSSRINAHVLKSSLLSDQEMATAAVQQDAVESFMKLQSLKQQSQILKARLVPGKENIELEEELAFIQEEISELNEFLQQCGCFHSSQEPPVTLRINQRTGSFTIPFSSGSIHLSEHTCNSGDVDTLERRHSAAPGAVLADAAPLGRRHSVVAPPGVPRMADQLDVATFTA